jgi:hypothetical protein
MTSQEKLQALYDHLQTKMSTRFKEWRWGRNITTN